MSGRTPTDTDTAAATDTDPSRAARRETASPRAARSDAAPPRAALPGSGTAPEEGVVDDAALLALGRSHFEGTHRASGRFFRERAEDVVLACRDMARRFQRGGRLLAFSSPGAAASDAFHVSVEFVHPVLVGKRALPALALEDDPARRIELVGRPRDIALGLSPAGADPVVEGGLRAAARRGLLTVALTGPRNGDDGFAADHLFAVEAADPTVVQEVHETLYHVLWELVHVYLEHGALP